MQSWQTTIIQMLILSQTQKLFTLQWGFWLQSLMLQYSKAVFSSRVHYLHIGEPYSFHGICWSQDIKLAADLKTINSPLHTLCNLHVQTVCNTDTRFEGDFSAFASSTQFSPIKWHYIGGRLLIKLKLTPLPLGGWVASLLSLYYTLLLQLPSGNKIYQVKPLRFCPGKLGDLECASSNVWGLEARICSALSREGGWLSLHWIL